MHRHSPLMRSPLSRSQTPTAPSQSRRFFQVWLPVGLPFRADHSAYFGLAKFYLSQPFQPSTEANLESCSRIVNARFQCNRTVAMDQKPETQPIESLLLNEWEIKFFPFFHKSIRRSSKAWGNCKDCAQGSGKHLDAGRYVRDGCTSSPHNVGPCGLHRWRLSWESGPVWHWSSN
jgi:hypothetical protein